MEITAIAYIRMLYAIAPREFSHSRTGTFNCRTKTSPHPKQLNNPAFTTALTDRSYLKSSINDNILH